MSPNSVDPGSALFAQTYLSENLGSLRYLFLFDIYFYMVWVKLYQYINWGKTESKNITRVTLLHGKGQLYDWTKIICYCY